MVVLRHVLRVALIASLVLAALAPASAGAAGLPATQRALGRGMSGLHASGALAIDLDTGQTLYSMRATTARVPASVEKLYTTSTALRRFGAGTTLETRVRADTRPDDAGTVTGNLYLQGGGDPFLTTRDLKRLAARVKAKGVRTVTGRVIGDESDFDLLRGPPSSAFRVSSYVGPLGALVVDHGLTGRSSPYFQASPGRFAAQVFAKALRAHGVHVRPAVGLSPTPLPAVALASWPSAPMRSLVASTLLFSDNYAAETLLKGLGAQFGEGGSTADGVSVVTGELRGLPIPIRPTITDGSGLSRGNHTTPQQVVSLLEVMNGSSDLADALPVAGRTGTLRLRMRGSAAQDRCRAKTGTLSSVSSLAGYCTSTSGAHIAFAILMNGVSTWGAQQRQDAMVAALARYADTGPVAGT